MSRNTIRSALRAAEPPKSVRAPAGSKLDPFKGEIHRLLGLDPTITGQRIRELIAPLALADLVGSFDYVPHGGSPVSMDLFALATLPAAADEAGGSPPTQVLRASGQPLEVFVIGHFLAH